MVDGSGLLVYRCAMAQCTIELKGGKKKTFTYDEATIVKSDGEAVSLEIDCGNSGKSGTTFNPPREIKVMLPDPPSFAYSLL